jgi:succinyl-CoA synthetase beta subunit
MRLTEVEGKNLFNQAGISIPQGTVITKQDEKNNFSDLRFPVYLKAQVLHGNRASQELVLKADNAKEESKLLDVLFNKIDQVGQPVESVLIEQSITFTEQVYLSISYDTKSRSPMLRYSTQAGEGIEERSESIQSFPFSIIDGPTSVVPRADLLPIIEKLWQVFLDNDATLVEVNPLVLTNKGWYCLDAKVELDDVARFRHPEWEQYGERSNFGRPLTPAEMKAHEVSQMDHRGVAGESFFEIPGGNIGVMASGGGASTLLMDALLAEGLKPANYTEYSGNPVREKVYALTKVVMSLPNLDAVLVAGSNAGFTDIYETLSGVVDGLLESPYIDKKGFIVVIRRGGPRWEEAFAMVKRRLQDKPITLKLLGPDFPLMQTAAVLKQLVTEQKGPHAD